MGKKVLVVDDSALMRRVVSDIINADENFEVVATAPNGKLALEKILIDRSLYQLILVDIQMPVMNGVELLHQLKNYHLDIPVIVISSIASKSAKETMEALELGAFDFAKKPDSSQKDGMEFFRKQILRRCYAAFGEEFEETKTPINIPVSTPKKTPVAKKRTTADKLVVIVSSTGGPRSLQSVIPKFPEGFPYPIVVLQHMPEGFTESLAQRLDELSPLHVKEAEDGESIQKGNVYIAMGGKQCEIYYKNGSHYFRENDKPARGGLKPCGDILLESLAESQYPEIICGIMTGMGSDGTNGVIALKEVKDVTVVAQDEATSVVYGMPRAVFNAGMVDKVAPLEELANAIIEQTGV